MRPMRAIIITAMLVLAAACSGAPAESEDAGSQAAQSDGQASEPAAGTSTGAAPSVAPPASVGGDPEIPDDAELARRYDCVIADLTPPGGTEVGREEAGELDLGVFLESSEPFDTLVAFYAEAIPAAGYEILEERDDFPGSHEWRFSAGEFFQPFISLSEQSSGSRITLGLLGIPPDC